MNKAAKHQPRTGRGKNKRGVLEPLEEDDGMPLIGSGKVGSPVEYLDIVLPSGYEIFVLTLSGIVIDSSVESICAAMSRDAGVTFLNDFDDGFNTYRSMRQMVFGFVGLAADTTLQNQAADNLIVFSGDLTEPGPVTQFARLSIEPGGAASYPVIDFYIRGHKGSAETDRLHFTNGVATLNPAATIPPSVGRINLLRIQPYGNGSCAPPTSGVLITAGSWFLRGEPTPA